MALDSFLRKIILDLPGAFSMCKDSRRIIDQPRLSAQPYPDPEQAEPSDLIIRALCIGAACAYLRLHKLACNRHKRAVIRLRVRDHDFLA